jgi:hypothetical protein
MPYITETERHIVDREGPWTQGQLNYALTMECRNYIERNGGLSYRAISEAIGALECCKLELYRRLAAPYEDQKIYDNGDVYG